MSGNFYPCLGISLADVGGAVAEAILEDIRKNGLGLDGFPAVHVTMPDPERFHVALRFEGLETSCLLTTKEAKAAVKSMNSKAGYDPAIFRRVQDAVAELEGKARGLP